MIRRYILTCAAVAMAASVLCSCGGRDAVSGKDGKLQYTPQVNEVAVTVLERKTFNRHILSNGRLSASSKAALVFGVSGIIDNVNVCDGQAVRKGETIASLDCRDIRLSADAAELALKKAELDMYDVLAGQGYPARDTSAVPKEVLEVAKMRSGYLSAVNELSKARYNESRSVLRAPFSGRVADVKFRTWSQASASEPFCMVIDDSVLDVEFTVLESDYQLVAAGLPVKVSPFGVSGKRYPGKIVSINPAVDKNGQVSVRAQVRNDGSLVDGMNVKVTVEKEMSGMLVVPKSAVVIRDNLDVAFRYNDRKAEWVYVNILHSNSDSYAIEANADRGAELAEGDLIIVSGNLNLADGSSVKLKE
ncbi:MAG: efflux RND transporter periplasmic adaptor subunit [Clostridium sp.]|nr:efflux RND transporter periplasmic adaptor subunit [Bacteroides sp.]MCM1197600.1 efflux RND transporter periplasmic adaptor subunit [Clostridium sp.]